MAIEILCDECREYIETSDICYEIVNNVYHHIYGGDVLNNVEKYVNTEVHCESCYDNLVDLDAEEWNKILLI